ncbi:hypothetical protein JCM11641_001858 [Rhodosporidiobolus odoratus]
MSSVNSAPVAGGDDGIRGVRIKIMAFLLTTPLADLLPFASPSLDPQIIEREMATLRLSYGSEALLISTSQALKDCEAGALQNKVVLVTGGSKGFGREYAVRAAGFGAKVVIGARGAEGVEEVVKKIRKAGGQATGLSTDVSLWEAQLALFKHGLETYGSIDVVVANAGIFEGGLLLEDKVTENGKLAKPDVSTIEINVLGSIYTSKLAFHYLSQHSTHSHKALIILGSLTSYIPSPGCPLYVTSKHALLGLQRSLALESEGKGIRCATPSESPAFQLY